MIRSLLRAWLVCAGGLAVVSQVSAQTPYLAKGNQEANVFGGLSYGLDHWRGSFGANYAIAPFNKYIMVYGEYSYFPGITRTTGPVTFSGLQVANSSTTTSKFQDIHAGVHLRLPVFSEKRIVPYVAGGLGLLRSTPSGIYQTSLTTIAIPTESSSHFAINGGGGIRLYLTGDGRFGLRLEAKTYKPMGSSGSGVLDLHNDPFGKISLGLFYQFQ